MSFLSITITGRRRRRSKYYQQHLCLDRIYSSKIVIQQIIKRGYVPHIPYKRKEGRAIWCTKRNIKLQKINDGLSRGQILGIIDSESCLQGMKRRLRTTLD